jgi:hypothetical protein
MTDENSYNLFINNYGNRNLQHFFFLQDLAVFMELHTRMVHPYFCASYSPKIMPITPFLTTV